MEIEDPCYYCTTRELHCHSKCEKYLKWKDNRAKVKAKYLEEMKKEAIIHSYVKESNIRNRKKKHLRR